MIKIYKDKDSKDTSNDLETFNLGDVPILYRYRRRIPIFYKYNGIGKKVNYYFETMAFEETTIYSLVRYSIIKERAKLLLQQILA